MNQLRQTRTNLVYQFGELTLRLINLQEELDQATQHHNQLIERIREVTGELQSSLTPPPPGAPEKGEETEEGVNDDGDVNQSIGAPS